MVPSSKIYYLLGLDDVNFMPGLSKARSSNISKTIQKINSFVDQIIKLYQPRYMINEVMNELHQLYESLRGKHIILAKIYFKLSCRYVTLFFRPPYRYRYNLFSQEKRQYIFISILLFKKSINYYVFLLFSSI